MEVISIGRQNYIKIGRFGDLSEICISFFIVKKCENGTC